MLLAISPSLIIYPTFSSQCEFALTRLRSLLTASRQLQPAETLWTLVDEPIVNTFVPSLDKLIDTVTERCRTLTIRQPEISSRINFA